MKLEIDIHPAQAEILRALLFTPAARFSELNLTGLTNDHFSFHIKRLVDIGVVDKSTDSRYSLSKIGKEFANRLDTDEKVIEKQAKLGALLVPVRQNRGQAEYLIQERLKQPFYGFHGFMTGKIRWGETVLEAAARELEEETGLAGKLKLVGIYHKLDCAAEDGRLLEDKYFYVVRATDLSGELMEKFEGGRNFWMTRAAFKDLKKVFGGMEVPADMAAQDKVLFQELRYTYTEDEY